MTAPTIAVVGFGRCGSTLTMRMLAAAGIPPIDGSAPGTYEAPIESVTGMTRDTASGHVVKVLDLWRHVTLPALDYRFVWLDRDPLQQARSHVKFLKWTGARFNIPDSFAVDQTLAGLTKDRPKVLGALRRIGPVEVMQFERILADPHRAARQLDKFCTMPGFDRRAAAGAVFQRTPECRPTCAIEDAYARTAR